MIGILIDWLECQGDYDLKLFVPSAFARNIDYKKLKEELALFKKEKDNLIFLLNLSKERREIEKIKESIKLIAHTKIKNIKINKKRKC